MKKKLSAVVVGAALAMSSIAPSAQATTTGVRAVAQASSVTVKSSVTRAKAGQSVTFSGRAPANARIVIQYLYAGKWYSLPSTGRAGATGTFKKTFKHVRNATVLYRVAATAGKKTTYSPALRVALAPTVRSYWLADYNGTTNGLYRRATAILGTETVTQALIESSTYASQWRINRACSRLTALAGAAANDSTRVMRVDVMGDGRLLFSRSFTPGQTEAVNVPLGGVEILTVGVVQLDQGEGYTDAGLGNVQISCTSAPGQYDPR